MRFAEAAGRLAGVAGALLGWRPDEFWRATPAELGAVLRALMPEAEEAVSRDDLERLKALFPDGWIVAVGAGGAWAGRDNNLAMWTSSGWRFVAPAAGMRVWDEAAGAEWRWMGTAWTDGALHGSGLFVGGEQVVSGRQAAIASPSGGTIIDAEARAALDQVIVALKTHGLID